jgi:signal transduction histidine kinase
MNVLRSSFTLRQLLAGPYLIGMIALICTVTAFLQQRLTDYFRQDLLDNGRTIAQRLAVESRLSIIQGTDEPIRQRLETVAAYPNVSGIALVTAQGKILSALGSRATSPPSAPDGPTETVRHVESDDSIAIVAPVFERGIASSDPDPPPDPFAGKPFAPSPRPSNIVGFVSLALSKAKLHGDIRNIQRQIVATMGIGILSFTLAMLLLLRRITRPIKRLAHTMADPETAERFRQIEVRGVREARTIATAYNALIARVAETHRELLASQADLARRVEDAVREVKAQNAELVVAREKAEAASRAKSQFVATVSHEIRTPLHGFVGFIDILAKTPLDRTQQGYLRLLKHSASVLSAVIDGVLDFSKLEAGKIALRARPFDLRDAVETTARLFAANARAKGLELEIAPDSDLPERVSGDRHRFAQIARNLVDNAIKFTERGQIRVRVGGRRRPDGAFLCRLSVRDTGVGIPRDHRRSIFAAFDQVDTSITRRQDGTGLGLAICRQLVDLMKGRIKMRSREGIGSEFRVEIPFPVADPAATGEPATGTAEPGDDADDAALPPPPPPVDEPPSVRPRIGSTRVLVVDDNRINRIYSKIALSDFRTEVVLVESGHEALEACRRQRFDLILMDVRMPGLDGLETTRRIRRWRENPNCRTPIVGLTADVLNVDRQSWRDAGMNDCLHKPLIEERMRQVLAAWGAGRPSGTGAAPNPSR